MTAAYEAALIDLALMDRDDPITEILARAIVGITSMGERDSAAIKRRALNILRTRKTGANAERRTNLWSSIHDNPYA